MLSTLAAIGFIDFVTLEFKVVSDAKAQPGFIVNN
jgi:hypothetical protein